MDIYELIKSRRSPRGYYDKGIKPEDLEKMFDYLLNKYGNSSN